MKEYVKNYILLFSLIMITALEMTFFVKAKEDTEDTIRCKVEDDIIIELPANNYILTQMIEEDDPYIIKVGADREQIEEYYRENGIILNTVDAEDNYEIVLTRNQNNGLDYIYNMRSLSNQQVRDFAGTICQTYETYGYEIRKHEIYEANDAKYAVIYFGQLDEKERHLECKQYYTIRGNNIYNITLRCYADAILPDYDQIMKRAIDSIIYLDEMDKISITDIDSGINCEIQNGWDEIKPDGDFTYYFKQYTHSNGMGESIQLICLDLWGNMTLTRQFFTTRDSINTQHKLSQKELEDYAVYLTGFFTDYSQVQQTKINGTWYLYSNDPIEINSKMLEDAYKQRSYVTIINGILYAYQYGYYEGSDLHENDFTNMVHSIVYKEPSLIKGDEQVYNEISRLSYIVIAVAVVLVIMIVTVIVLYIKNNIEKK